MIKKFLITLMIISLVIFIGCLGTGSDGDITGAGIQNIDAMLSGKVYFDDRQLYGGIPISVRYSGSPEESVATTLYTDNGGYYYLTYIDPGIYDLVAVTGDSEVIFARGVQISEDSKRQIGETPLLCVKDVIIRNIATDSFDISFHSNMGARATLSYSTADNPTQTKTISSSPNFLHEATISGLKRETSYDISLTLTSSSGQTFIMKGLNVTTAKLIGPSNMAIAINNGAFETYSSNVNVYLSAENAAFMRFGENSDLSDSVWMSYSQSYNHTFSTSTEGTKRLYVQFKDVAGNISPIQSDSILLTTSGYVGIWINGGATLTNDTQVKLRAVYPQANNIMVANSPDFLNSFWEMYSELRNWKLSDEDGTKKVYVKFKGGSADENKVFVTTIELDTTPPHVEMEINNGSSVTATTSVKLDFTYTGPPPSHMKITNTIAPSSTTQWLEFQSTYNWIIPKDDGEKTVYALFKDTAGNEYGPISASINLDQTPPEGNSAQIMSSTLSDATQVREAPVASLPVYLTFDITDETTARIYYAITSIDAEEPDIASFTIINKPFLSVEIRESVPIIGGNFAAGNYKIWVYFADEANNKSYAQTITLSIEGPKIIISPTNVALTSGGKQTFSYSLENVTTTETGTILWSIDPTTAGSITSNGIFTATSPILVTSKAYIIASSTNTVKYLQESRQEIALNTKLELLYENASGSYIIEGKKYTYDPLTVTLENGDSASVKLLLLHSNKGIEITGTGYAGHLSTSVDTTSCSYGTIVKINYDSPLGYPDGISEEITFSSIDDSSLSGSIRFNVDAAAAFKLDKTSISVQRTTDLSYATYETINAIITNPAITSIRWQIAPTDFVSFSAENHITDITTVSPPHKVTIYATGTLDLSQTAYLTATANTGETINCNVEIIPNVAFSLTPATTTILPLDSNLDLTLTGFERMHANGNSNVKWSLKQINEIDFSATGNTLRGFINITDNNHIVYTKPSTLPSKQSPANDNKIIIKAVSLQDNNVFATANINLADDVTVLVYDNIDKIASITSCSTVAEVGKKQFYAEVYPNSLLQKNVTWSIVDPSSTKGTIDETGLYTAPNNVVETEIKIRATSQYDSSAYTDVIVKINEFWKSCRTNMYDVTSNDAIPVSVIKVDPFTSSGDPYVVYAGTKSSLDTASMFGYGVWSATFTEPPLSENDTWEGNWTPIGGSVTSNQSVKHYEGKYIINDIAFTSSSNLFIATANGLFFYDSFSKEYVSIDYPYTVGGTMYQLSNSSILSVVVDNSSSYMARTVFVSTTGYILKLTVNENTKNVDDIKVILDCRHKYYTIETRTHEVTIPETPTASATTETQSIDAYSYAGTETNVYNDEINTMIYNTNRRTLTAGGKNGNIIILHEDSLNQCNLSYHTADKFLSPDTASVDTVYVPIYELTEFQPTVVSGGGNSINRIVQDNQNNNTLWFTSVNGVYRSTDYGNSWTSVLSVPNCRALIVDSTNTTNAMAGGENGVYRIINGISTQITTGLGNHNVMLGLDQSVGAPGKRRRVWVGTSGGVFLGREPLELQ